MLKKYSLHIVYTPTPHMACNPLHMAPSHMQERVCSEYVGSGFVTLSFDVTDRNFEQP
jgi:hypothetical protein